MITNSIIRANANEVYSILQKTNDIYTFDELKSAVGLNDFDLAAAIGWLAHDDKLNFYEQNQVVKYGVGVNFEIYF